jgi:arabinofuranosyltransferase
LRPGLTFAASIFARYLEQCSRDWPAFLLYAVLACVLAACRHHGAKGRRFFALTPALVGAVRNLAVLVFISLGLKRAVFQASLVDDAFVSFRYARDLADGGGLALIASRCLEGDASFLWTALLGGATYVTGIEPTWLSLFLTLACFAANVYVVYRIGLLFAVRDDTPFYVPLACLVLSINSSFSIFATTGLENMLGSLLIDLGAWSLLGAPRPRRRFLSGLCFVLAALNRPDHLVFLIVATVVLLRDPPRTGRQDASTGTARRGSGMLAFLAPLSPYLLYLTWRFATDRSLPPGLLDPVLRASCMGQGLQYAATFFLGTHFWIVTLLMLLWAFGSWRRDDASLKVFILASFGAWNAYVIAIGGDAIHNRLYTTLMPLMLLGAERAFYSLGPRLDRTTGNRKVVAEAAVLAFLAIAMIRTPLLEKHETRWGVGDASRSYTLHRSSILTVDNHRFREAIFFKEALVDSGINPVIGTDAIGMIGYYTGCPIVALHGPDGDCAGRGSPADRSDPGRAGTADWTTLRSSGVEMVPCRLIPEEFRDRCDLRTRFYKLYEPWCVVADDDKLVAQICAAAPQFRCEDYAPCRNGLGTGGNLDPEAVPGR